jgi:hypothetical protein
VIIIFDGKIIFRQYIPSKRKHFDIKIYILCDISSYTYDIKMYLGKDTGTTTCDITATHYTVTNRTHKVQGVWHQIVTYTLSNKNQAAWNFLSPAPTVTWRTFAIIIQVV